VYVPPHIVAHTFAPVVTHSLGGHGGAGRDITRVLGGQISRVSRGVGLSATESVLWAIVAVAVVADVDGHPDVTRPRAVLARRVDAAEQVAEHGDTHPGDTVDDQVDGDHG